MLHLPPYLKKNDTVLLIGTARARNHEQVQFCIDQLQNWGFKIELSASLFKTHHQFAGTDDERAEGLQWAIDHPYAAAVIVAGGGYGTLRIIDRVNFDTLAIKPKWFVGYSDATVLHSRILHSGFAAIHGTMAFQFDKDVRATESLHQLLCGEQPKYDIPFHPLNKRGRACAEVVGGNLSLIYALSGSRDEVDMKGKILFIEDLDEQLYHIDRMMLHLKRSGKLKGLCGLVVGGMTEMKDNAVPFGKTAEEIIHEAVQEYAFPVCFNFPAGHIACNMALYLGRDASFEVSENTVNFNYL